MNDNFKETINYTIDENGFYCGHAVNCNQAFYGKSLEEIKSHAKTICRGYLEYMTEVLSQEDCFNCIEHTNEEYDNIITK